MSNTMHIHKTHVVEYADSGRFNWSQDKLHNLLDATNIEYTTVNEDCPEYDETFSIPKTSIINGIALLTDIDKGENLENIDLEYLCDCLDEANYTLNEWKDVLQWMLDNSDKRCDYVYVEFF